jgi:hypothetical protein
MATTAEYNTGFFSSPADLKTAADLANQTVASIDSVVSQATSAPTGWAAQWAAFKTLWTTFYTNNFSSTAKVIEGWLTSDLEGQLVEFQGSIATWGAQAAQYGATVPGGVPTPQTNNLPDWFPSAGTAITIGIIVLATVVVWKVF